jgi:hypothetical protein
VILNTSGLHRRFLDFFEAQSCDFGMNVVKGGKNGYDLRGIVLPE